MRKKHPFLRFLTFTGSFTVGAWLSGFLIFIMMAGAFAKPTIEDAVENVDAIVVLTGGSERIETGIDLLKAGKAKKLFISGVYPKASLDEVLAQHPIPQNLKECCIFAGHEADNTVENAEETRLWAEKEGVQSVRLVTSNYHMLRSLLLFRHQMPDMIIRPHTVAPEKVKLIEWWRWPGTLKLLITEYNKYLVALMRVEAEPYL